MPCTFSCQLPRAVSTSTGTADARLAPAAQQRQPVDLRQPEVEHDGVVPLGLREEIGALAVRRAIDGVSGVAQRGGELPRQHRLVLNDQHSQPLHELAQTNLNGG